MNTTNLFVELFVIGIGAAVWILLLLFSVLGYAWVDFDTLRSWNALLPIVAFIYVLGIVVDRIADTLLRKPDRRLRDRAFAGAEKDYHYVRTYVFYYSEKFKDIFDYSRSKLRICRAWIFNFALNGIATVVLVWTRIPEPPVLPKWLLSVLALSAGALLAFGSWHTWYRLTNNFYVRLLHAYTVINEIELQKAATTHKSQHLGE